MQGQSVVAVSTRLEAALATSAQNNVAGTHFMMESCTAGPADTNPDHLTSNKLVADIHRAPTSIAEPPSKTALSKQSLGLAMPA